MVWVLWLMRRSNATRELKNLHIIITSLGDEKMTERHYYLPQNLSQERQGTIIWCLPQLHHRGLGQRDDPELPELIMTSTESPDAAVLVDGFKMT